MALLTDIHKHAHIPTTPLAPVTTVILSSSNAVSGNKHYEAVRTANSMLCEMMLRKPMNIGRRESEEVRQRMRTLRRLEIVWGEDGVSMKGSAAPLCASRAEMGVGVHILGEERVQRLFAKALRDGYVLCQYVFLISLVPRVVDYDADIRLNAFIRLMNKLRHGSIPQVDSDEDGILRISNVTKFIESYSAHGFPLESRFLPGDLIEATLHSLSCVARTIIVLVTSKSVEVSTPTHLRSLRDRKRPQVKYGPRDPPPVLPFAGSAHATAPEIPIPPQLSRKHSVHTVAIEDSDSPFTPSSGSPIHLARDQPISRPTKNQSTSRPTKNRSTSPSTKDQPTKESTAPSTRDIYASTMNQSTTNHSLINQSKISSGSLRSQWTNKQSIVTSARSTVLSYWTNEQYRVSAGSILSHWTNSQSRAPSPWSIPSLPTRTQFTTPSPKRVTRTTKGISSTTENMPKPLLSEKSISPSGTKESPVLQRSDEAQHQIETSDFVGGFVPESAHPPRMTLWYQFRQVFARLPRQSRRQSTPKLLQDSPDHPDTHGHSFVDATFSKCMSPPRS